MSDQSVIFHTDVYELIKRSEPLKLQKPIIYDYEVNSC